MMRVGPYELEAPIGRGGMAEVFRARAPDGRAVVVKRILPELAADADFRAMLEEEARNVRALRHPGIVSVVDSGEDGGVPYLVLDLVDGLDLGAVIRRTGPLPPEAAARAGADVASALAHAHGQGVVHRDVTPGNILVDREGRARLVDFGIARAATSRAVTMHGTVKGKPGYLAPEQALGGAVDGRTDLYALGVTLAEALTGRPLFEGEGPAQAAARLGAAGPEIDFPDGTPRRLREVVLRCLEPDPAARPADANEAERVLGAEAGDEGRAALRRALDHALVSATVAIPLVDTPRRRPGTDVVTPRAPRARRRSLRWPIVFSIGLLAAGIVGYRAGRAGGSKVDATRSLFPPASAEPNPLPERTPDPVAPKPKPELEAAPAPRSAVPAPAKPARSRARPAKRMGTLVLLDIPRRVTISIDEEPIEVTNPDYMRIDLEAGLHHLRLETRRGEVFGRAIVVPADGEEVLRIPRRGPGGRRRGGRWR